MGLCMVPSSRPGGAGSRSGGAGSHSEGASNWEKTKGLGFGGAKNLGFVPGLSYPSVLETPHLSQHCLSSSHTSAYPLSNFRVWCQYQRVMSRGMRYDCPASKHCQTGSPMGGLNDLGLSRRDQRAEGQWQHTGRTRSHFQNGPGRMHSQK